MNTFPLRTARGVADAPRPPLLERVAAWLSAPAIHELDARTLADIGASQTLRAQAELREAWRLMDTPHRWTGL